MASATIQPPSPFPANKRGLRVTPDRILVEYVEPTGLWRRLPAILAVAAAIGFVANILILAL